MKIIVWGGPILIVFLIAAIVFIPARKTPVTVPIQVEASGPFDATYIIEGESVSPGATTSGDTVTKIFGEPIVGDLNGDAKPDAGVMLQQTSGGTGTFYYLAAAINTGAGYRGTNALFIGDRIAPQTLEIKDGFLIANYADRKLDEPFSEEPSVGKSLYAQFSEGKLTDVTATKK